MVSTLDFESKDPSSSLGRTFFFFFLTFDKYFEDSCFLFHNLSIFGFTNKYKGYGHLS